MAADVLYITFDGVLQPLGFSQVVRVVAGLGERGLRYHLLSLERPTDLRNRELRSSVENLLSRGRVRWTPIPVATMGSPRLAAQAVARVLLRASAVARRERIKFIHARGYHGALIAGAMKRILGLPYLFDARGYWIEERSGPGGWFSTSTSYATGKLVEQVLFRGAEAVVTLTELQAIDIDSGLFGPPPRLLKVIPTCADYEAFYLRDSRPAKPHSSVSVPLAVQQRLNGKTVVGIVGALNDSYFVRESLLLAKFATQASPAVHLLVLSAQRHEYEAMLRSSGMSPERFTVTSAEHMAMPEWLQWIDWGLLLLRQPLAKRGSMPTKLAEFFAAGVRPLFLGCNSEATQWVERAASGHVLPSIDENHLRSGAQLVVESVAQYSKLRAAREITRPHFSLTTCLDRYGALVLDCLRQSTGPPEDLLHQPSNGGGAGRNSPLESSARRPARELLVGELPPSMDFR